MDKVLPNIGQIFGFNVYKGDVGIEIEMEGHKRFPQEFEKIWRSEDDGSLRGHSIEYVMKRPVPIDKVGISLDYLKEAIEAYGSKPKYSERAGVHVHVNVQDMNMEEVFNMALIYYCLETALVRYCGSNREGNHFCLRVQDAEGVLDCLEEAMRTKNLRNFDDENIRYASLNFCSLSKYGSIEFRAMETQPDFSKIKEWANMLYRIREYAKDKGKRSQILFNISSEGPTGWASEILGEELFKEINYPDFDRDVIRCMRPLQHLFFI